MSLRTRHWKQRWDPKAELVFVSRMRVGTKAKPFCLPGDKVTKAIRDRIGPHRLRLWFETGVVKIADWKAPEPQRERAIARAAQEAKVEDVNVPEPEAEDDQGRV